MPLDSINTDYDVDHTTAYAERVLAGEIVVSDLVRKACERHLKDLKEGASRGLYFDKDSAARVFLYFEEVLKLRGGKHSGKPFKLFPWQFFVLGSLFGWLRKDDGTRRFRTAYIETGKGSGKSPLAAGIGLYGLTADNEAAAEVYAAAAKTDQAQILFRDAVSMVNESPLLDRNFTRSGSRGKEWMLYHPISESFFRTISSDKAQSGSRPHIVLLDEIHEHQDGTTIELMSSGIKDRRQPLVFMITNSGHDKTSVCWNYHDYGSKVASRVLEDDEFFAFICGLDKDDDPFNDESCWPKANPSLEYGLPGMRYLRGQVQSAKGMPSREAAIKRLNFCVWTDALSPWISTDIWSFAEDGSMRDIGQFIGRKCWGGLDLSSTSDLTALVFLFEPDETDPYYRLMPFFWLPGDNLLLKQEQDRVPYLLWRDRGYLEALPGAAIDKSAVLKKLVELSDCFDVQSIAYDRWRIEDLKMQADREGMILPPMQPFGQGYKDMSPALDKFETALLNHNLKHPAHPILTWCAANAVTTKDPANNRKVDKSKATGRVDGIVASIMAFGLTDMAVEMDDINDFINDPIIG